MANSFETQIIEEGPRNAIVKLTGVLDTSNLTRIANAVDVSTLTCGGTRPAPTSVRVDHLDYSISDQLELILDWDATTPVALLPLAGRGRMSYWNFGGLQNNAGAGKTGDIGLTTDGWTSGTQVFTIILELVKQGPQT